MEKTKEKIQESKFSNSQIGSYHWFVTLMAVVKHTGEYLREHGSSGVNQDQLKIWGQSLFERSNEIIEWFKANNIDSAVLKLSRLETTNKLLSESNGYLSQQTSTLSKRIEELEEALADAQLKIKYFPDQLAEAKANDGSFLIATGEDDMKAKIIAFLKNMAGEYFENLAIPQGKAIQHAISEIDINC
jgi:predicted nuclease with TOPRIM domain